jgi:hypothetical protein
VDEDGVIHGFDTEIRPDVILKQCRVWYEQNATLQTRTQQVTAAGEKVERNESLTTDEINVTPAR